MDSMWEKLAVIAVIALAPVVLSFVFGWVAKRSVVEPREASESEFTIADYVSLDPGLPPPQLFLDQRSQNVDDAPDDSTTGSSQGPDPTTRK